MAEGYVKSARPGAVFLFHDGGRKRERTLQAVTKVVKTLQSQGYRFIAADEMFKGQ
jgi:peptidoglycan/xylan/chitin deacetylase (PgdA/CDA1 family)